MEGLRPRWAVKATVVIIISSVFFRCVSATNHYVGGPAGWDLGSDLRAWSAASTFFAGDNLVFDYGPLHDVLEVDELDYTTCRTVDPIKVHNDENTVVQLSEPGIRYFICGRRSGRHCAMGLKLQVEVLASSSAPAPTTTATPHPQPQPIASAPTDAAGSPSQASAATGGRNPQRGGGNRLPPPLTPPISNRSFPCLLPPPPPSPPLDGPCGAKSGGITVAELGIMGSVVLLYCCLSLAMNTLLRFDLLLLGRFLARLIYMQYMQ